MERLQGLLLSLKEIKALKGSRICFQRCYIVTYSGLQKLIPVLKEVTQKGNVDLVFDNCASVITVLQWRCFMKAIRKVDANSPCKIKATFIGKKKAVPTVCLAVLLLFGLSLLIIFPIALALTSS